MPGNLYQPTPLEQVKIALKGLFRRSSKKPKEVDRRRDSQARPNSSHLRASTFVAQTNGQRPYSSQLRSQTFPSSRAPPPGSYTSERDPARRPISPPPTELPAFNEADEDSVPQSPSLNTRGGPVSLIPVRNSLLGFNLGLDRTEEEDTSRRRASIAVQDHTHIAELADGTNHAGSENPTNTSQAPEIAGSVRVEDSLSNGTPLEDSTVVHARTVDETVITPTTTPTRPVRSTNRFSVPAQTTNSFFAGDINAPIAAHVAHTAKIAHAFHVPGIRSSSSGSPIARTASNMDVSSIDNRPGEGVNGSAHVMDHASGTPASRPVQTASVSNAQSYLTNGSDNKATAVSPISPAERNDEASTLTSNGQATTSATGFPTRGAGLIRAQFDEPGRSTPSPTWMDEKIVVLAEPAAVTPSRSTPGMAATVFGPLEDSPYTR